MPDYRDRLQALLRELFQFDSADLDFGFYAVMNQKRDRIERFIETDLLDAVTEGLQHLAEQGQAEAKQSLENARQQALTHLGNSAVRDYELNAQYENTPAGKRFLEAKAAYNASAIAADLEAQIYNDLYEFFSRYFQDGDFISQRRYGASNKYAIPYNGQEVHLHWANFDQYYVKTGVHFQNYSFTVPGGPGIEGEASVRVRLAKVDVPRDNIKGDKRFFVFAADQAVEWDAENNTLVIPVEYRPLTPEESKRVGSRNQQDKLLAEAYTAILEAIEHPTLRARLTEVDPHKKTDKDRLAYHLNRYAAENSRDFFVHKDLGGFLHLEFDYYLKAEVLHLKDINFDDPLSARRASARMKTLQTIGERIIAFLDQLERFQRQLFLKRKFVLQSDYCLTLDKIPAERRAEFYSEILANNLQLAEWKKLYSLSITPDINLDLYPHLMLDTCLFDQLFKIRLMTCFDDLEDALDGLLIHSENFQALNFLQFKYHQRIKSIYIDPPYNTSASEIIYKNGYKHSTWLAFQENRLQLARNLMFDDSILCVTIDDSEFHRLYNLIRNLFDEENILGTVPIRSNPSGRSTTQGFAISHEYAIFSSYSDQETIGRLPRTEKQLARYGESDSKGRFEWVNFRKHGGMNANRSARPKLYYPIYINETGNIRIPEMEWNESTRQWDILEKEKTGEIVLFPINTRNEEKTWKWEHASLTKNINDFCTRPDSEGKPGVYMKSRMRHDGVLPSTWWDNKKYSATDYGTNILGHILGSNTEFSFPKSVFATLDCLRVSNLDEGDICLDFYAGSGTTAHSVIQLKNEDSIDCKYILVEMGEYFDTVLKPRIQKVVYADEWKDGKPKIADGGQMDMFGTGHSHMFQYIRLESYDDTFHNIRFQDIPGPQLSFLEQLPDYTLGYLLEHEVAGSPTLLDIEQFQRPFEYQLLVTGDDGVLHSDTVDLVTTFNFLIGLTVRTIRYFEHEGNPYARVTGETPDGKRVCVVWRNALPTTDLDVDRDWVLENILTGIAYDRLYINAENTVPDALLIEDEFKRRMFEGVI